MPKTKRERPLYQRGGFRLNWDRRADGSLRSPYLTIFWHDGERRGGRSRSTGKTSIEEGKAALDAFYLERSTGRAVCPACQRPLDAVAGYLVTEAISTYQTLHADKLPSASAIRARLDHVLDYIDTLPSNRVPCETIDEAWIGRFRAWSEKQPIVSQKGNERQRSLSTTENSVIQMAAAINDAWRRRNLTHGAGFKAQQVKDLNRTPQHRSDIAELAAMFRYCVDPRADTDAWRKRKIAERARLHRFLIISVATMCRPDAAHDASVDRKRAQWNSRYRVFNLNPKGRRQTKKRRPIVPVAWQAALHLDQAKGYFVGVDSVKSAWEAMVAELGLPSEGESGMKLIRRSIANIVRQRMRRAKADIEELEMMLGHRPIDSTSELYAPFDPDFLATVRGHIEDVIDEIEAKAPGAFALPDSKVVTLRRKAN